MFVKDVIELTRENKNFRKVLYTGVHSQIVVMTIPIGGEIGEEAHTDTDQILFFVEGNGEAILAQERKPVKEHDVVFVPSGMRHNFKNTGDEALQLFTVYAPPHHPDGTIHTTKEEADKAERHT